jgi:diguanylate cyclase (GGDEF)-like protein/PAS domain S-box-containing protein
MKNDERYLEFENILNSMLDPVHITNKNYEIEFVNRACIEVFGLYTHRVKCYKYFHNFESQCEWCRHEEVMLGKSYHSENYFNKTKTYFDANHSPITKANGEIAKLVILRDITERKKAEESLRDSEAHFQALFNTMAEGVAVHEIIYDEKGAALDYLIVKANHAYEIITGIAIKDAEGKRASELYRTEKPPFFDIFIDVAETGKPHDFVTYFEPMKKYFRISVFSPGKGRFATVFDDITESRKSEEEREKTEASLKLNEDRLETLLELTMMKVSSEKEITDFALEEVVRLTRSKGGYLHFFNEDEQTIQLYSWSKDVLKICTAAKDEHYPLDKAGVWADSVRLKRPVIHNDYQNLSEKKGYPEGHFHLVRHLGVPIFDGDSVVGVTGVGNKEEPYHEIDAIQVNLFMNSMWQILKQKRTEAIVRKLSRSVEQSPISVVITDTKGDIEYVNPKFSEITGYTADEAIGKNPRILKSGKTQPEVYDQLWKAISSGKDWHGIFCNKKKNGDIYWESATISPVLDESGNITHYIAVKEDITEIKKAHDDLKTLNQLLELQATTDALTGIFNRLKFDEMLMKEVSRSKRYNIPLSLVMFDIDHFKDINDTFGHHTGDVVLKELTSRISQHTRKHDYFARWGGEEFMILLTHTTLEPAVLFAESCRMQTEEMKICGLEGFTCSFGVTELKNDDDIFSFTRRVDAALYKAKSSGRNRVEKL